MKILSVNAGSSSLKFTLFDMPEGKELISGTFERIGIPNSFYSIKLNGEKTKKEVDLPTHSEAISFLIDELIANKVIENYSDIKGIGHRIVSGGEHYTKSVLIDNKFMNDFVNLIEYAPLHNPAHLIGIRACQEKFKDVEMVVVFDTAFHQSMDIEEFLYAGPYEWYEKYGVRKYGAHGTSHRYIDLVIKENLKQENLKVITCHVGNGSSITAIDSGKVIDTSMGFTPLAGVVMGTRSGDIDSSIIPYIMKKENKTIDDVMNDLNKKSGLLSLSGFSNDSRDIEEGYLKGDERCILAQNIFCKKIANYIAMYNNLLNGADVICFTAGIGENSSLTRKMVAENLKSLGIKLDEEANKTRGKIAKISSDDSKIMVYIVPTNEELMIAQDTYEIVTR